ncbi:MAG: hypothetical protein ACREL9_05330 [Gemmatimonadales bacterium]
MRRPSRRAGAALVAGLALACNDGLQPVPDPTACPASFLGICGTVQFQGAIPDSTDYVLLVAYEHFPQRREDLFTFLPLIPPRLPLGGSTAFYRLRLPAGRYEWVLAVWKKQGTLSPQNADSLLREAGYYREPLNPSTPGVVLVAGPTDSIDFVVDFANMHPVSFYFPSRVAKP